MSDERKIEDEDVEAHTKLRQSKLRQAGEDGGDDVEAHTKLRQSKLRQASEDGGDDDVEAHIRVRQ